MGTDVRDQFACELAAPQEGDLMVWWIPQVPGRLFRVAVASRVEGQRLLRVLAAYDLFQLAQRVKPDFCNAGGLCIFEDGDWCDVDEEEDS